MKIKKEKKIIFFDNQSDWTRFKEKKKINATILCGHIETQEAIKNGECIIFTYDLLSMDMRELFSYGYRIFLKQKNYQLIEIRFGTNNWTNRGIDYKCNLLRMYKKGQMTVYLRRLEDI